MKGYINFSFFNILMKKLEIVRKILSDKIRDMRENNDTDELDKNKEFLALRMVYLESKQSFTYSQFLENLKHKYEENMEKDIREQIGLVMDLTSLNEKK